MSIIRIANNEYPLTIADVGSAWPNKAIPSTTTDAELRPLGFAIVHHVDAPAINPDTETVSEVTPELVGGVYRRKWEVSALSAEEVATKLSSRKTLKLYHIEQLRDARRYADVTAHNRQWQANPVSQDLLNKAIVMAQSGLPLPSVWRDSSNNNMEITTVADLLAIAGAIAQQTQDAYAWSWAKKAAVEAATTIAAVDAISLDD